MSVRTHPRKTVLDTLVSAFVVLALLVGGLAVLPGAAARTLDDDGPWTDAKEKDATFDIVYGNGVAVSFSLKGASSLTNPKATVKAFPGGSTTASRTVEVPLVKSGLLGSATDSYWVGRIVIDTASQTGLLGSLVQVTDTPHTISISHPDGGATPPIRQVKWFPTYDHAVTHPKPTDTTKVIHGPGKVSVHVTDKDQAIPSTGTSCGTSGVMPRFLVRTFSDDWVVVPTTSWTCTRISATADAGNFTLSGLAALLGLGASDDGTQLTLRIEDVRAKNGLAAVTDVVYTYTPNMNADLNVLENDYRTPVTGDLKGVISQYVLRVNDTDANKNDAIQDTIKLRLTSLDGANEFSQMDLTLAETRSDSGEFQGLLRLSGASTAGALRVKAEATSMVIKAQYSDLRDAAGVARTYFLPQSTWRPFNTATLSLVDPDDRAYPSGFSTLFGTSAVPADGALFDPASPGGTFVAVKLNDKDLLSADHPQVVVRNKRLLESECTARDTSPAGPVIHCRTLKLTQESGSTFVGYILFTQDVLDPMPDGPQTGSDHKAYWTAVQVADLDQVVVEYEDPTGATGASKVLVRPHPEPMLWREAFDGALQADKDSYFVGESMQVTLSDPDQTDLGTKEVRLGIDGQSGDTPYDLAETATKGVYKATIPIGPSGFPATDGQRIRMTYQDATDGTGKTSTILASVKPLILQSNSGSVTLDKRTVPGTSDVQATLVDANARPSSVSPMPVVKVSSKYGPAIGDTVHLDASGTTWTKAVKSEYGKTTKVLKPTPRNGNTAATCYYDLVLDEPFEAGLTVLGPDGVAWSAIDGTPAASGTADPREFQPKFADGMLRLGRLGTGIDNSPTFSCNGVRTGVDNKDFTVVYVPASTVFEQFVADGTNKVLPLGRYSGVRTLGALPAPDLPVDGSADARPLHLQDTSPTAKGATTGTFERLFAKSSTSTDNCQYVAVAVNGVAVACADIQTLDLVTAKITLKNTPAANSLINVTYRASGYVLVPSGAPTARPILLGSFRWGPTNDNLDKDTDDLPTSVQSDTATARAFRDNGTLPAGVTCPCAYRTDVQHNAKVAYGEPFTTGFERTLTVTYTDEFPHSGSSRLVTATAGYSPAGVSTLDLKTIGGQKANLVHGFSEQPVLELVYPSGNTDNTLRDTTQVTFTSNAATETGLGTTLETETLTLTETGPAKGIFRLRLTYEQTAGSNNGKIMVGTSDAVLVTFEVLATGQKLQTWFFRPSAATLTLGATALKGNNAQLPVTVADADAENRILAWYPVGASEISGNVVTLSAGYAPISAASARAYICDGTATAFGTCTLQKRVAGDPDSTTNPAAGEYLIKESSGRFKFGSTLTNKVVRIDFRTAAPPADTVSVSYEIFDTKGTPRARGPVSLTETLANSNTFFRAITVCDTATCDIQVDDGEKVRITYLDRNYDQTGRDTTKSCDSSYLGTVSTDLAGCAFGIERDATTSVLLSKEVTWTDTKDGVLAVSDLSTGTAAATNTLFPVHGTAPIRIAITDPDQDKDPSVPDTVTVQVVAGASTKTITLRETGASTDVFQEDVVLRDQVALAHDQTFDVRYTDPAGVNGNSKLIRLSDTTGVNNLRWRMGSTSEMEAERTLYKATETVEITLYDADQNTQPSSVNQVGSSAFSVAVLERDNPFDSQGATKRFAQSAAGLVSAFTETGTNSGVFRGTIDLTKLTNVEAGRFVQVTYTDAHDASGREAKTSRVLGLEKAEAGVPRFSLVRYESLEDLVTVTVQDRSLDTANDVDVQIHVGSLGSNVKALKLTKDGTNTGRFTGTFAFQTNGNLPVIPVKLDERFFAVYHDGTAGSSGFTGPGVYVDSARLVKAGSDVVSSALPVSGTRGEKSWFVTPPTVRIAAAVNPARVAGFEYRLSETATWTPCNTVPCDYTFTQETTAPHRFHFRAIDVTGVAEKDPKSIEVKFDRTAPTAVVSDLNATSKPAGAVGLTWTSAVDTTDPTQFGNYKVWVGSTTGDPTGNATERAFTHTPSADGEYTYYVAVADEAGNVDRSKAVSKKGTSDRIAPVVLKAGALQKAIEEGKDEIRADLYLTMNALPADFDKVNVRVDPPAGGVAVDVPLARSGTATPANFTGTFTSFNVTGAYTFQFQALDKAGNFEPKSTEIRFTGLDRTAPVVEVPATVTKGQDLVVVFEDNDSGLALARYKVDSGEFTAVSLSGNPLTKSVSIPTTALALGEHTLDYETKDMTGNVGAGKKSFTVTEPGGVTPGPVVKPTIVPVEPCPRSPACPVPYPYISKGDTATFKVTSAVALTELDLSIGGTAASLLSQWSSSDSVLTLPTSGLAAGPYKVSVSATNTGGTTTLDVDIVIVAEDLPLPAKNVRVRQDPGTTDLIVEWDASPTPGITGYLVHRQASPFQVIAVLGADARSYADTTTEAGREYVYQVTAFTSGNTLEAGDESDDLAGTFALTQTAPIKPVGAAGEDDEGFFAQYWWVFLILLAVLIAVSLVYVYRDRLFASKTTAAEEEDLWAEHGEGGDAFADESEADLVTAQYGMPTHDVRCPACTTEFTVSGEKPIVTNCPNCGRKGILR